MNYRFFELFLFLFVCSILLTSLAAQAQQTLPLLHARKSSLNRHARLGRTRQRTRSGAARFFYPAPTTSEVNELVAGTALQFEVDPQLVLAIIQVESSYNTNAVSSRGAQGLMQLVPDTAHRFGARNAFNPRQNIHAGVGYLKHLLQVFSGDVLLSIAAYNAGEHAVLRLGRIPAYRETVAYVRKVATLYRPELLATMVLPLPALRS